MDYYLVGEDGDLDPRGDGGVCGGCYGDRWGRGVDELRGVDVDLRRGWWWGEDVPRWEDVVRVHWYWVDWDWVTGLEDVLRLGLRGREARGWWAGVVAMARVVAWSGHFVVVLEI